MSREAEVRALALKYSDPLIRAQRIYLEMPSYAAEGKADIEFEIKQEVSAYFGTTLRNTIFCGSAHLGFSPSKGNKFIPGQSDLDIAIIDPIVFQKYWQVLNDSTRAFNDLTGFSIFRNPAEKMALLKEMIVKRGVINLDLMPKSRKIDVDRSFLDGVSKDYEALFKRVSVAFYMNEYAYCWKQNSAIEAILPR